MCHSKGLEVEQGAGWRGGKGHSPALRDSAEGSSELWVQHFGLRAECDKWTQPNQQLRRSRLLNRAGLVVLQAGSIPGEQDVSAPEELGLGAGPACS